VPSSGKPRETTVSLLASILLFLRHEDTKRIFQGDEDQMNRSIATSWIYVAALPLLAACGDLVGANGPQHVDVNFRVGTGGSAALVAAAPSTSGAGIASIAGPPMVVTGSNGTLTIDEIRLIVAEMKIEGDDDPCEQAGGGDDCAEFEAPPRFLDLPLDGQPIAVFGGMIPPGTYEELEFEIEDLEDDEEDTDFAAEIAVLRETIQAEFPDWPRKATALVVGSFESDSGTESFRVYIEAEIEIERALVPPIVITDGEPGPDLNVELRPDIWFMQSDGTVLDLSMYDFDATGQVLEFELEMEDGITEIEIEFDGN